MKPGTRAVLALLRERPQGVTALDALEAVGSFRLAARIWELRSMGYDVRSDSVTTASGKHVERYRLVEQTELGLVS